jgi:hypothetical protein
LVGEDVYECDDSNVNVGVLADFGERTFIWALPLFEEKIRGDGLKFLGRSTTQYTATLSLAEASNAAMAVASTAADSVAIDLKEYMLDN